MASDPAQSPTLWDDPDGRERPDAPEAREDAPEPTPPPRRGPLAPFEYPD